MIWEGWGLTPLIMWTIIGQTPVIVNLLAVIRGYRIMGLIVDSVLLEAVLDATESGASKGSCRFITTHVESHRRTPSPF